MQKMLGLLFLLYINTSLLFKSQTKDVSYTIHSSAGLSSDTTLPFWLAANQYGSVPIVITAF